MVPSSLRIVKNISLGKTHAIMHGVQYQNFVEKDVLYVLGDNRWGQLGINPNTQVFVDKFIPAKI